MVLHSENFIALLKRWLSIYYMRLLSEMISSGTLSLRNNSTMIYFISECNFWMFMTSSKALRTLKAFASILNRCLKIFEMSCRSEHENIAIVALDFMS